MRKTVFAAIFALLLLCSCGTEAQSTPAPPPPTPAPTAAPTPAPTEIILSGESPEEILALAENKALRFVDGRASEHYAALSELSGLLPDCRVIWELEIDGQTVSSETESLVLSSTEGLAEALPYLPGLKRVDLLQCPVSTEQMDVFSTLRPDVDFLWLVSFGNWQVRSDISCFSTLRTGSEHSHRYTSEELYPLLRYCRKLRALDLGHNDLTDISLIGEMPQLQVLILADNPNLKDISPLGKLKELHYLELFLCWEIEDFSCLYELEKMQDLNLSYCRKLSDISFIDNMPDFRMGWFRDTSVSREQVDYYDELLENADFLAGSPVDPSSVCYGWRSTERNLFIRNAFTRWREVVEYRHWTDIEYMD